LALALAFAIVSKYNPRVDLLVVTSGIASCMGGVGPGFGIIAFDWSTDLISRQNDRILCYVHHRSIGADAYILAFLPGPIAEIICSSLVQSSKQFLQLIKKNIDDKDIAGAEIFFYSHT
jgi:hypothetical protein